MLDLDVYLLAWEFYTLEAISVMLGRSEYGDFQPMRHSHSRWYPRNSEELQSGFCIVSRYRGYGTTAPSLFPYPLGR